MPDAPDADAIRGWARETLIAAGRRAESLALGAEARAYFERAATLAADETQRASLLADAGGAAARTADRAGALLLLGMALSVLEAGGERQEAARTRMRMAEVLVSENRLEEARELMDTAREALDDPAALAALAAARPGGVSSWRLPRRAPRTLRWRCRSPIRADLRGHRGRRRDRAIALGFLGRITESGALLELGLRVALDADLSDQALRAHYDLADDNAMMGRLDQAQVELEHGLALARERGNRAWNAI